MTLVTGLVSLQSRRNRESNAAPFRLMTDTAFHTPVARVIELHVKRFQRGKRLHRRVTQSRVRMTDRADRAAGIGELLSVATCARRVPGGTNRPRRGAIATVT